jgi:hypothetical protein
MMSIMIVFVSKKHLSDQVKHVACVGRRCKYRVLVGKTDGKRPLGRPRKMLG